MCGYFALINQDRKTYQVTNLHSAMMKMKHRGPDAQNLSIFREGTIQSLNLFNNLEDITSENFIFAHCRLAINDLDHRADQPLHLMNGKYSLVFNGEIYNFKELRIELEPHYQFQTTSDSEVIVYAYDRWGADCLSKFNGMWSFVLIDHVNNQAFISRDRMGVKPLYWSKDNGNYYFSSEIKPLLHFVEKIENKVKSLSFLLGDTLAISHETEFKDIFVFPPASYTMIDLTQKNATHALKFNEFWKLPNIDEKKINKKFNHVEFKNHLSEFKALFQDAVKIRLLSDVQFGTALSGGLDSSAIAFQASEINHELNAQEIQYSFCNTYENTEMSFLSEKKYAEIVNQQLNINALYTTPQENQFRLIAEEKINYLEHLSPSPEIASYYVYQLPHKVNVKITLDGQGSDEQTGGYLGFWNYYCYTFTVQNWKELIPISFQMRLVFSFFGFFKIGKPILYALHYVRTFKNLLFLIILGYKFNFSQLLEAIPLINFPTSMNLREFMRWKFQNSLRQLIRAADANSMQFSIESRMPFLDFRIIEFMHKLPTCYLFHNGWTKYILREAFSNRLSDEIVWRKSKQGFDDPDYFWLKKEHSDNRIWSDLEIQHLDITNVQYIKKTFLKNNQLYMRLLMYRQWKKKFLNS